MGGHLKCLSPSVRDLSINSQAAVYAQDFNCHGHAVSFRLIFSYQLGVHIATKPRSSIDDVSVLLLYNGHHGHGESIGKMFGR